MKTQDELTKDLAEPFSPERINWKIQTVSRDKKRCMVVPYIDARDVMARLDEVVGAFNWQTDHKDAGITVTGIGIRMPDKSGDWIWKYDAGYVDADDARKIAKSTAVKGTASEGLKRAGVAWGIGRYLYDLPKFWVDYDDERGQPKSLPDISAATTQPAAVSQKKEQRRQQTDERKSASPMTEYWQAVYNRGWSNSEGADYLKLHDGDAVAALEALVNEPD